MPPSTASSRSHQAQVLNCLLCKKLPFRSWKLPTSSSIQFAQGALLGELGLHLIEEVQALIQNKNCSSKIWREERAVHHVVTDTYICHWTFPNE